MFVRELFLVLRADRDKKLKQKEQLNVKINYFLEKNKKF